MTTHIVHKQQVTLNLPKREDAHAFQNRVSDLLRNELSASMEAVFDELFPTIDIIRIDSLILDLGKIEAPNFEQEFKIHFIEALRKNLSSQKSKLTVENNEDVLSPEQSLVKAFIYFLENGYLPWYSPFEKTANWSSEILNVFSEKKNSYFFNWLRDNYEDKPVVLQRLILQFNNTFLGKLLTVIGPPTGESWNSIYSDLEIFIAHYIKGGGPVRNEIWKYIFQALLNTRTLENNVMLPDTKDNGLILNSLYLLTGHFNISSHDITTLLENRLKGALKTKLVKNAFLSLKSLLISQEDLKQDLEDPLVISKAKETELSNTQNEREEVITDKLKGNTEVNKTKELITIKLKDNTEVSRTQNEEEEIIANKPKDSSETNKAKNADSISTNKGKETHKVGTNDTHDVTNNPDDINIEKTNHDIKKKNIGEEKLEEERKNREIPHADKQDDALLKQRQKIAEERLNKSNAVNATERLLPQNKKHTDIIESGTLYIKGSGIVILHYFLSPYFNDLGLLADGKFIDDTTHQRAVLLLHYLATGKTKAPEFNLTLSKILCGYPISETLPTDIILTKKEKTESKRLLEAIINHWSPLKNTSIKGLRGAFFERDGKLTQKENGWLLTVEQRTIDVLLGKLPWGYSTIRLPWMQEILNVDWY